MIAACTILLIRSYDPLRGDRRKGIGKGRRGRTDTKNAKKGCGVKREKDPGDEQKRSELALQLSLYALFRLTAGFSAYCARLYAEV